MNHVAETLTSFKELDRLWAAPKGTAFLAFKHSLPILVEQQDYFHLDAVQQHTQIEALRTAGRIYLSSVNVVLLSKTGISKLPQP